MDGPKLVPKALSCDVVGAAIPTLRVFFFLFGLPRAGSFQRGGFMLKDFWTRIVFWPGSCLVELAKSYVRVAKSYGQVAKCDVQVAKSEGQVAKSYVQAAKFSSSVFR